MKQALIVFSVVAMAAATDAAQSSGEQPNIVLILADDLGYADIGAYGNKVNRMPNLDRMARNGLRLTDFHTNGANCSPTRAAILKGQYQQRCGIEGALGEGAKGLPQKTITIAERLRDAGYVTGMMGKWHLGYGPDNGPTQHGFDEFVGHLHGATDYLSHVDKYGRMDWWHNEEPVNEEGHNTMLITRHSVRFIRRHADKPFFLFVSHSAIHFPWQSTTDKAHRVAGQRYEGAMGKLGTHAAGPVQPVVQAMIEELDASVGEILAAIKEQNLEKRTLVFFTSDNGGSIRMAGVPIVPVQPHFRQLAVARAEARTVRRRPSSAGDRLVAGSDRGRLCFERAMYDCRPDADVPGFIGCEGWEHRRSVSRFTFTAERAAPGTHHVLAERSIESRALEALEVRQDPRPPV